MIPRDRVSSLDGAVHEHRWQNCMLSRVVSFRNRSASTETVDFSRSIADFDAYDAALERFLNDQPKSVQLDKGALVNVFVESGQTRESRVLDVSMAYFSAQFGANGVEGTTYLSHHVPICYCFFSGSKVLSQVPLHSCLFRSSFRGHITLPILQPRWRAAALDSVISGCLSLRRGSAIKTVDGVTRFVLFNDTECRLIFDYDMIGFGYSKVADIGVGGRFLCTDAGCIQLGSGVADNEQGDIVCVYSSFDAPPAHTNGRHPVAESDEDKADEAFVDDAEDKDSEHGDLLRLVNKSARNEGSAAKPIALYDGRPEVRMYHGVKCSVYGTTVGGCIVTFMKPPRTIDPFQLLQFDNIEELIVTEIGCQLKNTPRNTTLEWLLERLIRASTFVVKKYVLDALEPNTDKQPLFLTKPMPHVTDDDSINATVGCAPEPVRTIMMLMLRHLDVNKLSQANKRQLIESNFTAVEDMLLKIRGGKYPAIHFGEPIGDNTGVGACGGVGAYGGDDFHSDVDMV